MHDRPVRCPPLVGDVKADRSQGQLPQPLPLAVRRPVKSRGRNDYDATGPKLLVVHEDESLRQERWRVLVERRNPDHHEWAAFALSKSSIPAKTLSQKRHDLVAVQLMAARVVVLRTDNKRRRLNHAVTVRRE